MFLYIFKYLLLLLCGIASGQFFTLKAQTTSSITFVIKNAGLNVEGSFTGFKSNITFDPKSVESSSFSGKIQVATINTGISMRDKHLLKEEYFFESKYPNIFFKSSSVRFIKEGQIEVLGAITIKGISKPIKLIVAYTVAKNNTIFRTALKQIGRAHV